jgi:DNA ligase-1
MNQPWDIIAELETDNSRLFKESVIRREAQAGNQEFFEGCRLALDSMVTFGVKQVPEHKGADGAGLDWEAFSLVLTGFVNRQITGNLARGTITQMMSVATREQWNNWYRRILIKDLRCGVSEKTINNVVERINPEYVVPVFSCQLAHDSANHESKLAGRRLIEVKLDGVRVITIVRPDGRVDQFSRNGKELVNFEHVKQQISTVAAGFSEPMVMDGEIMSSSFQDLMRQVHRKSDVKAGDAVLNLFDILPLADFERGTCALGQEKRSQFLQDWYGAHADSLPNVSVLEQEMVDLDSPDGQARFREINQLAIDGGYEGIMIKDPNASYECKRTVSWLKLKPYIEVSLTAVAVEEGTGKNVGRMGAVLFEGQDLGKTITVSVGGGWSDDDRERIWQVRDQVAGQVGEIRADAVTQNQDGTYSLRFPRFKIWRGFAMGEKI